MVNSGENASYRNQTGLEANDLAGAEGGEAVSTTERKENAPKLITTEPDFYEWKDITQDFFQSVKGKINWTRVVTFCRRCDW